MGYYLLWKDNSEVNIEQLPGVCVAKWRYAATEPPDKDNWIQATPKEYDTYRATVHDPAYADWVANPPEPSEHPEIVFAKKAALGYFDETTGITLKCTESAQQRFTALVTTLREQLDAGEITSTYNVKFGDINDQFQTLSITDFRALMRRYAKYCMVLFSAEMVVDAGQVTSAQIVSPTWWQSLLSLLLD